MHLRPHSFPQGLPEIQRAQLYLIAGHGRLQGGACGYASLESATLAFRLCISSVLCSSWAPDLGQAGARFQEQSGCAGGGREGEDEGWESRTGGLGPLGCSWLCDWAAVFFLTLPMTFSTIKANLTRSTPNSTGWGVEILGPGAQVLTIYRVVPFSALPRLATCCKWGQETLPPEPKITLMVYHFEEL